MVKKIKCACSKWVYKNHQSKFKCENLACFLYGVWSYEAVFRKRVELAKEIKPFTDEVLNDMDITLKHLIERPEIHNQKNWIAGIENLKFVLTYVDFCNTPRCFAGDKVIRDIEKKIPEALSLSHSNTFNPVRSYVISAWGLTETEANALFDYQNKASDIEKIINKFIRGKRYV